MNDILSVSEITGQIKETLENNFFDVNVIGEISNFKQHVSGHWYFTLKDNNAQINCTMWRGLNNYVFFTPQDGIKVIVSGRITVYPPRGNYQIDVKSMKAAGVGELQAAFEKLKQKLEAEGLFDEKYKKEIPQFPQKIGIVTAIDGAALQDIISIATRRFPLLELIICPTKVQGEGAAEDIVNSIKLFNKLNNVDLIIVGRGGGSLEDLWAFNEEIVARAIFESEIPIISAVGHEVDTTIADYVADLRAATPSAAIELATPNRNDILNYLEQYIQNLNVTLNEKINEYYELINDLTKSYGFKQTEDQLKNYYQTLDNLTYILNKEISSKVNNYFHILDLQNSKLNSFDIDNILKRGFSYIIQDDKVIPRLKNFNEQNSFTIKFYDGDIKINGEEKRK
ncbi:exodeoxyribonuclease VII large subunit [Stygiobacter electus]|uniref:Exodeoxyribonuclease 7 large subunit n=1 Tax=Stygiobacter electus TaxID=3032292 RepID=A0AAE3NYJ1_9BACT|nr:exodeoxyribonuclease VII large subunit [Stygiobacter electus]MDF1610969.1 exodeoxyribonuclease VII large subunit [Stygiobacter electus]